MAQWPKCVAMECVVFVKYLNDQSIITKEAFVVETGAGLIEVTRDEELVEMNLGTSIVQPLTHIEQYPLYPVTLATEHAVIFEGIEQKEVIGPLVTNHPTFNDGVNTNFVIVKGPASIFVQTHERGAGWTLSCGTGAAASAACAVALGFVTSPVQVDVPGGTLEVRVASDVFLKGPANKVAEGVWV
jgi:Diaminopimelate epimerase